MLTTQTRMREIGLALMRARPILEAIPADHPLRIEFMRLASELPLDDHVLNVRQAEIFAACVARINALELEVA